MRQTADLQASRRKSQRARYLPSCRQLNCRVWRRTIYTVQRRQDATTWSTLAPDAPVHRRRGASQPVEQVDGPDSLPPVPARAVRKVEALRRHSQRRRRIVWLVFEEQRVPYAEVAAAVDLLLDPGAQPVRENVRLARNDVARRIEPDDVVAGNIERPRRCGGRGRRQEPWQPSPISEVIRLVAVAVERVIDGVVNERVVPAPAFEAAHVAVLRPAHLLSRDIDHLILSVAAAARPRRRVANQVREDVNLRAGSG